MNWLRSLVLPRMRAGKRRDIPGDLWIACPGCRQMIFNRDLEDNLRVCPKCDHHLRLPADRRLAMLFDDGAYQTLEPPPVRADPLKFRDSRRYSERLREAQRRSGRADALLTGRGRIGGLAVVASAFDFEFMGGSMGLAVGEGLLQASAAAVDNQAALVTICSSGGARMQEGTLSLMQMPRSILAVRDVRRARLPYIVILADPTTGGVSASFAMLGDVAIAEPGAVIGFAGARVIEETIGEKLPTGFQRAEYLLQHGMVDMVAPRSELKSRLETVLDLLMRRR